MKIPMCEEMGRNTEVIEKTGQREVSHAICQSESKTEMSSQAWAKREVRARQVGEGTRKKAGEGEWGEMTPECSLAGN